MVGGNAFIKDTSSVLEAHAPLLIVQRNTVVVPELIPVIVVVAEALAVMTPLPLTTLHDPVPVVGVLAVNVAVLTLHRLWSAPAFEVVGKGDMIILTSSVLALHAPLLIVQRKVVVLPTVIPVTVVVGEPGVVIVHVPVTTLHVPVPVVAVLPDNCVLVTLHRF